MTAKVFQLLLHDAHTDGNSNPRQGNITAPAVRTSSSPRGVRRTPSRSAMCRNPFPKPQMLWAAFYHAAKSQRECVRVTYRRTNYTNNRMPFPLWGRLGTSFQCHYMALWNCSHVSCDRMHCIESQMDQPVLVSSVPLLLKRLASHEDTAVILA